MEEMKKRKLEDTITQFIPNLNETPSFCTVEELRALLDPLAKPQLVDLLSKAGSQYPSIAEDIKSVASADPALRKLFVRGLAWNTTSDTLCAAFQEHGEIEEGAVIYDKVTGKSRGYGFITYKDMQSAQEAVRAPSKMIDGRMAACNLASEGLNSSAAVTSDQSQRKLYVGGLSPETTSEMLLSFFRRHGEIEEGSVAYDKDTNKSRGFGFVTYNTVEAAVKAINDPQKNLGGRNITVKLADNHKGKGSQQQMHAAMVQVPFHMSGGYHQHKPYPGYGYGYPQYPNSAYSNSATPSPYPAQSPYPYPQYGGSRETTPSQMGLLTQYGVDRETPPSQMGNGGYPYHMPK